MKIFRISFICWALLMQKGLSAQEKSVRSLGIGEQVPNVQFKNVLNYSSRNLQLKQFRNKLVILDFWSVTCTSCISAFPKMEKLQKKFNDKLQILLVNSHNTEYDSEQRIKSVLTRLRDRTGFYPSLPIPIHDTLLNHFFPHLFVPHIVWIDTAGRLLAITSGKEVTEEKILSVLEGKNPSLYPKDDWAVEINRPLKTNEATDEDETFIYRSIFTGFTPGAGGTSGYRSVVNGKGQGMFIYNRPLRFFIRLANQELFSNINDNRLFFDVNNSKLFADDKNPANRYCYEIILPSLDTLTRDFTDYNNCLKEDLKRVFNISVVKASRLMKCVIINPGSTQVQNPSNKKIAVDVDSMTIKKYVYGLPFNEFIQLFDHYDTPIITDSKADLKIDIQFPYKFDLSNPTALFNYLKALGFEVKEQTRFIDVIVISDKN